MKINITSLPADALAEVRYQIDYENKPVFIVGFERLSLMSHMVYVTLTPLNIEALPLAGWRELKKLFEGYKGYLYYCQIVYSDKIGARFAEFFGFVLQDCKLAGRRQYQKDTV